MKSIILTLFVCIVSSTQVFSADLLTMVRDPATYEWTLQTLNNPAVRTSIVMAAEALPAAAAAVGVTVTSGVTLPLAGAVLGTAWLAQDLYNKQDIKREWYNQPQYVEMAPGASAKDFVCQPAHITVPVNTVTPQSFPNATEQIIGRPTFLSAPLGEFKDAVLNSSSPTTQDLKNAVSGAQSGTNPSLESVTGSSSSYLPVGTILITTGGVRWRITGAPTTNTFNYPPGDAPAYFMSIAGTQQIQGFSAWKLGNQDRVYSPSSRYCQTYNGKVYYWFDVYPVQLVTTGDPLVAPTPGTNYEALKTALKDLFQTNPDSVTQIFKELDSKNIAITDKVPSPSDPKPWQQTGPISQQELNNWYTTNNQNVANYNTTNITNNSTTQDIAKGVAATTAAQAAKQDFPDKIVFTGSADLPPDNVYDPTITQPEENSFVDKVHAFINSGLPVLSSIKGSGLTASGSPSMSTTIWNHPVVVDFSDQQTVLRAAGSVLVVISLIVAYCIIVRS